MDLALLFGRSRGQPIGSYIRSLKPLRISHQFTGYAVAKLHNMAICIMHQSLTVFASSRAPKPSWKMTEIGAHPDLSGRELRGDGNYPQRGDSGRRADTRLTSRRGTAPEARPQQRFARRRRVAGRDLQFAAPRHRLDPIGRPAGDRLDRERRVDAAHRRKHRPIANPQVADVPAPAVGIRPRCCADRRPSARCRSGGRCRRPVPRSPARRPPAALRS